MDNEELNDLERLFAALAEADAAASAAAENGEGTEAAEEALGELRARIAGQALAGTGARAARRLRGGGPILFISLQGAPNGPGRAQVIAPIPMMLSAPSGSNELENGDAAGGAPDFGGLGMPAEIMQAALEHAMRFASEVAAAQAAQAENTAPPAKEIVRDALPRVVVTKEDLVDETNSRCAVCLEDFRLGVRATRMFCGHLFCTSCIQEWLCLANSCPVCRYELSTNNSDYEVGRKKRMLGRPARLRQSELQEMRASELKRLLNALGISVQGCLEKVDLMKRLEGAPDVELKMDRVDVLLEESELLDLEMPLLRTLLVRHHVPLPQRSSCESTERKEAMQSLQAAGLMQAAGSKADSANGATAAAGSANGAGTTASASASSSARSGTADSSGPRGGPSPTPRAVFRSACEATPPPASAAKRFGSKASKASDGSAHCAGAAGSSGDAPRSASEAPGRRDVTAVAASADLSVDVEAEAGDEDVELETPAGAEASPSRPQVARTSSGGSSSSAAGAAVPVPVPPTTAAPKAERRPSNSSNASAGSSKRAPQAAKGSSAGSASASAARTRSKSSSTSSDQRRPSAQAKARAAARST